MWLCRIGLHSWTPWKITRGGDVVKKDGSTCGTHFTQERTCKHCGYTEAEYKQVALSRR
jgi:predicted nucleic-acid-binding Zn-ribbon protein